MTSSELKANSTHSSQVRITIKDVEIYPSKGNNMDKPGSGHLRGPKFLEVILPRRSSLGGSRLLTLFSLVAG